LFGGHNEGDTKVEDGVTYRLNANSRWERMDKPKASGKPSGGKKKAEKPAIVPVVEDEPAAQDPEPTVSDMLEQQQAEIAESKPVISGRQFVEEFISAWNDTHGSEWNRDAAGYTKAKIWDKKDGEIRVYFGSVKQPLVFRKQDNGEYVAAVTPGKYGLDEQIAPILDDLNSRFSTKPENTKTDQGSAGTQQRVLMQEDEDGVVAPAGQHERGVHIVREWYESEPSPKPTVGDMLEQQQAAIADEPMPEGEAMEGAEDDWESKLQELQSIGNQAKLDGPEGVKDDATEAPGVSYNPDLVQQRINQGYFEGRAFYSKAVQAMKAALSPYHSLETKANR
jgi:hypothetical protein